MEIEFEKIISHLLVAAGGGAILSWNKMRRDITCAHKKIRKLQNHLNLNENGDCNDSKKEGSP